MSTRRQFPPPNPPPSGSVRIFASSHDVADLMVAEDVVDPTVELDLETLSDGVDGSAALPFLTSARTVRCLNCDRLMYAADYIDNANHACIPAGQFAGVDLDSQVPA